MFLHQCLHISIANLCCSPISQCRSRHMLHYFMSRMLRGCTKAMVIHSFVTFALDFLYGRCSRKKSRRSWLVSQTSPWPKTDVVGQHLNRFSGYWAGSQIISRLSVRTCFTSFGPNSSLLGSKISPAASQLLKITLTQRGRMSRTRTRMSRLSRRMSVRLRSTSASRVRRRGEKRQRQRRYLLHAAAVISH